MSDRQSPNIESAADVPTEPKRRRKPAEVRAALQRAAIAELREAGPEFASLRSIARRVGITHQAVAYHFTDRTALFTAVATAAFDDLIEECRSALERIDAGAPLGEPVATVGETYFRFARNNRERFGVMFGSGLVDQLDPALIEARLRMWGLHLGTVVDAVDQGWGAGVPAEQLAVASWSLAHGLATLEGDLPDGLPVRADLLLHLISSAIKNMPAG